jgi:hypothetical protein
MTSFPPMHRLQVAADPDHPALGQRARSPAETRARWEVRAAQWRARELAEVVFGSVTSMGISGIRGDGLLRGLLRLEVPFTGLEDHREREARFLSAVEDDPVLGGVRLLYVIGPDAGSG